MVLATVYGAILATILARLTFADSTVAMALSIGGFAIFGFAMIVREVPGCPPLLARFAPAVAFAGWTIHGLPPQALSSAMFGAMLTTGLVFVFRAWWSRQR